MHLLWCRHCGAYARSNQQLAEFARRLAPTATPLDEAQNARVLEAVRRAISNADNTRNA
jgi:hypothetical protein